MGAEFLSGIPPYGSSITQWLLTIVQSSGKV